MVILEFSRVNDPRIVNHRNLLILGVESNDWVLTHSDHRNR